MTWLHVSILQIPQNIDQRGIARQPAYEYRYLTEFQSHEPEFDYLKSLEIEEKINKVCAVEAFFSFLKVLPAVLALVEISCSRSSVLLDPSHLMG